MTLWMTTIVAAALAGLAGLSILAFARERTFRPLLLSMGPLAGLALLLHRFFGFPTPHPIAASKSAAPSDLPVIGLLFASMLLGMLAHWLFVWLETPRRKRPAFDLGRFIAPVLASPIIFVPLLASQQNVGAERGPFDVSRFMVFLVAFENGFFWKEYFDNRQRRTAL